MFFEQETLLENFASANKNENLNQNFAFAQKI